MFWKICIFDLLIYIMYSSNFLSRLAWCIWVKSRMEYIKVIENGGSFHFLLWNKWRYRDITAIVNDYLFVSQRLDFIRHLIIFYCIFRFMGKLDEIWILSIKSTVWRNINVKLCLDVGNDEYTLFWVRDFGGRIMSSFEDMGGGGEKLRSPVSPANPSQKARCEKFLTYNNGVKKRFAFNDSARMKKLTFSNCWIRRGRM